MHTARRVIQAFLFGMFSAAASFPATAAETPFVVAFRGKPPESLSPDDVYVTNDIFVLSHVMEGLVRFNPDHPNAGPDDNLVSRQVPVDSLTYVFVIRKDVYFQPFPGHQHDAVTAQDVKFSIEHARAANRHFGDRLREISAVEAYGDLVKIKLRHPVKDFMSLLATSACYITSEKYFMSLGRTAEERLIRFRLAPIGTGPYQLHAPLDKSGTIELDRFAGYHGGWQAPKRAAAHVVVRYYDDAQKIVEGIEQNKVDLATLPASDYGSGLDISGTGSLVALSPPFVPLLAFNTQKGVMADVNARRLVNAAIDFSALYRICPTTVRDLPPGYRRYLVTPLERAKIAGTPQLDSLMSSPQGARALERLRQQAPLTILVPQRDDTMMTRILAQVRNDLKEHLGIEVRILRAGTSTLSRAIVSSTKPDLIYREWAPDTQWEASDLSMLGTLFVSTSPNNYGGFEDKTIDDAFERLRTMTDRATIESTYAVVEQRLKAGEPVVWLSAVRIVTLFIHRSYRAAPIEPGATSISTLVLYTPFIYEVRRTRS